MQSSVMIFFVFDAILQHSPDICGIEFNTIVSIYITIILWIVRSSINVYIFFLVLDTILQNSLTVFEIHRKTIMSRLYHRSLYIISTFAFRIVNGFISSTPNATSECISFLFISFYFMGRSNVVSCRKREKESRLTAWIKFRCHMHMH